MMECRKITLFIFAFILLALGGCRYRLSHEEVSTPPPELPFETIYPQDLQEDITEPPDDIPEEITMPDPDPIPPDIPDEPPVEYVPVAYVEAAEDVFSPLTIEYEDENARQYGTEEVEDYGYPDNTAGAGVYEADNVMTIEEPSEVDGDTVIGDDGGVVGLIATYSTILSQGVNAMFPCQLLYIYCETADELATVARGSELYQLMVDSGGVNVSSRLTADRLNVTADWVVRRNPAAIVKFVDGAVLGSGIGSTNAASELALAIRERPYWGTIEAIRHNRIILLSEQLLETDETRLAAQLLIAHMMYPELFEGIDVGGAVAELMVGVDGVYFYGGVVL